MQVRLERPRKINSQDKVENSAVKDSQSLIPGPAASTSLGSLWDANSQRHCGPSQSVFHKLHGYFWCTLRFASLNCTLHHLRLHTENHWSIVNPTDTGWGTVVRISAFVCEHTHQRMYSVCNCWTCNRAWWYRQNPTKLAVNNPLFFGTIF